MAAHSYWRLYITEVLSGTTVSVAELQFFDADGNSLCSGGTPFASSAIDPPYPVSQAFDGNPNTFWAASGMPVSIGYQFASPVEPASFRVSGRVDSQFWFDQQCPKVFKVQYSDNGVDYYDATSAFTVTSWQFLATGGVKVGASLPISAPDTGYYTAWRVLVNAVDGAAVARIVELQFRGTVGGSQEAAADYTWDFANSVSGGLAINGPYYGFHADANAWVSNTVPAAIGFDFPKAIKIAQISIKVSSSSPPTDAPTDFTLQGSNDGGVTWTDVADFTASGWSASETRTFEVGPSASWTTQSVIAWELHLGTDPIYVLAAWSTLSRVLWELEDTGPQASWITRSTVGFLDQTPTESVIVTISNVLFDLVLSRVSVGADWVTISRVSWRGRFSVEQGCTSATGLEPPTAKNYAL